MSSMFVKVTGAVLSDGRAWAGHQPFGQGEAWVWTPGSEAWV